MLTSANKHWHCDAQDGERSKVYRVEGKEGSRHRARFALSQGIQKCPAHQASSARVERSMMIGMLAGQRPLVALVTVRRGAYQSRKNH